MKNINLNKNMFYKKIIFFFFDGKIIIIRHNIFKISNSSITSLILFIKTLFLKVKYYPPTFT